MKIKLRSFKESRLPLNYDMEPEGPIWDKIYVSPTADEEEGDSFYFGKDGDARWVVTNKTEDSITLQSLRSNKTVTLSRSDAFKKLWR